MVGVTLYVSITTEENVKMDQEFPVMESDYGFSFICAVMSFVLQELTGVLTVYWFIYRFRALVRKQEKLRERTRELMGNCLQMTTALPLNLAHLTNSASKSKENSSTPKAYADYHHQPLQNSSGNRTQNARIRYMIDPDPQRLKPPRRRIPFDANYKTVPPSQQSAHTATNYIIADKNFIPRSPSNFYGEYCRILIRQEDMALLTKMVKSKSQALLLNSPTPSTRKQILMPNDTNAIMCKSTSSPSTSQMKQQQQHNPTLPAQNTRRSLRKGVKRTTSV
ncbi:unnamed protein product [Didymodactylos carnosus]|nr:unnamed protein product [Didymodactylos carnosus]CAF4426255.1 unnamed protein product [Didymodactylos carnosus]